MSGLEATAIIRKQEENTGRHIPIIALTASVLKGDRERCLAAGCDEYLTKPIDARALFQAMERLRDELPSLLASLGTPIPGPLREYIQSAPARNASEHADYADYFSAELRDLVAERDADLIDRHAYRFGA